MTQRHFMPNVQQLQTLVALPSTSLIPILQSGVVKHQKD